MDPAARAYDEVFAEYERGRPGYAPAAVAWLVAQLGLAPGAVVADVGAGTGKLTRMLAAAGLETVAVDASAPMLQALAAAVPAARTLVGRAEALPLPDAAVDAVTAAQAFHWFRHEQALAEIHRVLRPGGGVALVWNRRDETDPLQALLAELTDPPDRATPRGWKLDAAALLRESGLYVDVGQRTFPHVQPTDADGLVSRVRSSSWIAAQPPEVQRAAEERVRTAAGPGAVELRHTTLVYVARRRDV